MVRTLNPNPTKKEVEDILVHCDDYQWSLQGLGMLRLYLDDTHRMHIWDDRYQVYNVSQMHTHPWNFTSTVIVGVVRNIRYVENSQATEFHRQMIHCGEGGGLVGESDVVNLAAMEAE